MLQQIDRLQLVVGDLDSVRPAALAGAQARGTGDDGQPLGAGRGALRRTLLAESLVLCGAGEVLGLLLARPLVGLIARSFRAAAHRHGETGPRRPPRVWRESARPRSPPP